MKKTLLEQTAEFYGATLVEKVGTKQRTLSARVSKKYIALFPNVVALCTFGGAVHDRADYRRLNKMKESK